jgi:protoporphyrin/coproporphyrin ferrochelatase
LAFSAEPEFSHGAPRKIGVLLINLGTPDEPTPAAVRRYLAQFLADPRVVEIPRPLWWLILHGFVLRTRPTTSAKKYAAIWTSEGSPLRVHTLRQTLLLQGLLGERLGKAGRDNLVVRCAMRYGNPGIAAVMDELRGAGCDRLLALPLYPQYAASTTASSLDEVFRILARWRNQPEIRAVRDFHDHAGYIAALARSVNSEWEKRGRPDQLLMSFHGVPRFSLEQGDPYHCECQKTGRLLAEALGLKPGQYQVTFQSRFGRTEWLKPYTAAALENLAKAGTKRVDVVCPGFVADCLETLEEIAIEAKALFLTAGGKELNCLPCLNEADGLIAALADLVVDNIGGWHRPESDAAREASLARARALGASR